MDVRQKQKDELNVIQMKKEKLTDSLIFNIIKKIELRIAMEEKYEEIRAPQLTIIPTQMRRHLHSTVAMGYLGFAMGTILYLRFKRKTTLSIKSLLPHVIIAISINEFERYRNILNIDPELRNQFRSYQTNTKTIIEEMKSRVSLVDELKKINLITFQKSLKMIKYKPLY